MLYRVYLFIPGSHPFSKATSVGGIEIICIGYIHAAVVLLGCGIITSPLNIGIYEEDSTFDFSLECFDSGSERDDFKDFTDRDSQGRFLSATAISFDKGSTGKLIDS